jgi:hypothetical protein
MRRIAFSLAAAVAFAVPASGTADASYFCEDVTTYTAVCVTYTCRTYPCFVRDYTSVYTTCDHPMPPATCVTVWLPANT